MKNKTFEETVRSMSAKKIILAMVNGLEKPSTKIDMDSYGSSYDDICYGCAATNAVCQISKVKFTTLNIDNRNDRADLVNTNYNFLELFELAIDALRTGNTYKYNEYANRGKFNRILKPDNLELPWLTDDYTQEDLKQYKQLAKLQE